MIRGFSSGLGYIINCFILKYVKGEGRNIQVLKEKELLFYNGYYCVLMEIYCFNEKYFNFSLGLLVLSYIF